MGTGNTVRLADDGNDGGPRLQLAKHVEIQALVQSAKDGAADVDDVGLLASLGDIGIEARRVQNEEHAVNVGIDDTGRADDLLFFTKRVFELGLEERGNNGQLEVDNVLLESLRVPERDAQPLAIYLGLQVLGCER